MASFISSFANKIYSQFPQNEHAAKVTEIDSELQGLTAALTDTTSDIFKNKIVKTKKELNSDKETCLSALTRLNGEFFQDPRSTLKKAWDNVVISIKEALELKIEFRNELEAVTTQLKSRTSNETTQKAEVAIDSYTRLEKKRDSVETRLNEIISVEKTDLVAPPSEDALRQRQKELCGNYYQDPSSLLDKAWKKYQKALTDSHANAPELLNTYNLLENERKHTEILLKRLGSIAPATRGLEVLTIHSINEEIASLKKEKTNEEALTGIDWKKTAIAATKVSAAAAGYAMTYVPAATTLIASNL